MKRILFVLIMFYTAVHAEDSYLIFSGNANLPLAQKIVDYLGAPLGKATVKKFNDGEISINIQQSVRNKDVFIIQPTCKSVNDNIMELFLLVRTMKRSSAASITAVIPYFGYARQDRKSAPRVPISASDVAMLLEQAGADRVIAVDLHCGQIQGFFHDTPVDNLYASIVYVPYFAQKGLQKAVVVSPDAGGVDRAKKFKDHLERRGVPCTLAIISKQRADAGVVGAMNLIGSVDGCEAIIVDDICDTGGTLIKAAELLKEMGATKVFAAITHPVFSADAVKKIGDSVIDEMIVTDTIALREPAPANMVVLSVAPLLGEAIRCIQTGGSISELFQ